MIIGAIEANLDQLRPSERMVANFVLSRPSVVIHMSIADLAERAEVSEPTIMRFCKAVGCLGFMEFKLALVRDLERRTFAMNRANPAVKGPPGFGQALFTRVLKNLADKGNSLPLDLIDEILELCGVSRAITILHDGTEEIAAQAIVDALLACRLEANASGDVTAKLRFDGRVVIALRSAANLAGLESFCADVIAQDGKVIAFGFEMAPCDIELPLGEGNDETLLYQLLVLALVQGVQARLSRSGSFADTATDLLQSQREIAYGDARRRDRQHHNETLINAPQSAPTKEMA